jgi:LmbE family N-acetylglucosaminyl deacetylase
MKTLLMVAHPDDCILFGLGLIHHRPHWQWEIAYLTYTEHSERGQEISNFWHRRNIKTHWLGYVDDYRDIENNKISFDSVAAQADIATLVQNYQVVVTHDANGDYGHLHHVFVHNCVTHYHTNVVTFSPFGKGNLHIKLPDNLYQLDEIPQHASLGDFISPVNRQNEYQMPDHLLI